MHEEALFRDLRRKVAEVSEGEQARRVVRVKVWVGALSHVTESRLRASWPSIVQGTPAEASQLEVDLSQDPLDPRAQFVILASLDVAG
jgi:hydrogenase nickel incorporation protein HypA/HybF